MSDRQQKTTVIEGTVDQKVTINNSGSISTALVNFLKVRALERCFNGSIDRRMRNIGDTVKYGIQNAVLTPIDSSITSKMELAIRSINASTARDATSVMMSSERGELIRISVPFQILSKRF